MAKSNAINNASSNLSVIPGASGDQWIQFASNTTNKYRLGVDDDAGDSFKLSVGNALGTSDALTVDTSGQINKPLQPAFYAYLAGDDANVTGDGTDYVVGTNTAFTEAYDINSDFNTNGTFTAPVTGNYAFFYTVYFGSLTSSHTGAFLTFDASNHDIIFLHNNPYAGRYDPGTTDTYSLRGNCFVQMDASDVMNFKIDVSTTGKTVDLLSDTNEGVVVSGFLVN